MSKTDHELLPCPFCGSAPRTGWEGFRDEGYYAVECPACNGCANNDNTPFVGVHGMDETECHAAWNKRAAAPQPAVADRALNTTPVVVSETGFGDTQAAPQPAGEPAGWRDLAGRCLQALDEYLPESTSLRGELYAMLEAPQPAGEALTDERIFDCFATSSGAGKGEYMLAVGRAIEREVRAVDAARIAALQADRETYKRLLADLLAVVHRDGGHYVWEHGWETAATDAHTVVLQARAEVERLRPDAKRLDWLEAWHPLPSAKFDSGYGDTGMKLIERTSDGWLIDSEVIPVGGTEHDTLREAIDAASAK